MKKYFAWVIIGLLISVAAVGLAQTTHYANQVTITWDAPTTFESGKPIPTEIVLSYDVFIREKGGEQVLVETVDNPPYTVTFPDPGYKYEIGVLAKYYVDEQPMYSAILWSIQEGWDVGFFEPASQVTNFKVVE
ncbi:hypothetical protein LCGC14_1086850 [marine sediment metagenome]|uniref:Uncharacterized protein n=1 Tax=marine sediment metagenome TaxID=412755 RepID=A0A0F9QJI2_9ZZZZ